MRRIKYISKLELFVIKNPEIIPVLPSELLTEIYYYQRFQYKFGTNSKR